MRPTTLAPPFAPAVPVSLSSGLSCHPHWRPPIGPIHRLFSASSLLKSGYATLSPTFFTHQFSTAVQPTAFEPSPTPLPTISSPYVGYWLLASAAMAFGIIVVGGVTRLTESGLSITEWRPITGTLPPLSAQEWESEFEKYKATPEFRVLNANITLPEFKRIYYMEYAHRQLGRTIGLALLLPFLYLATTRRLTPGLPSTLTLLTLLLGAQGFLGWYMVRSGLSEAAPGAVPRVSQYRLAAHLGAALVLYAGLVGTGLAVLRDAAFVRGEGWRAEGGWERAWMQGGVRRFRGAVWGVGGLVFLTALSGAFVAGLDAGLIYNEFPTMGGRLVPPTDELFSSLYAKRPDGSDVWWRNMLENPTTTQFDHRVLATTTYISTTLLWLASRLPSVKPHLPLPARRLATAALAVVNIQVLLGITTLLYLVPVPLAAAHQAGSVALLTCFVALGATLRRPGKWARVWRDAVTAGQAGVRPVGAVRTGLEK